MIMRHCLWPLSLALTTVYVQGMQVGVQLMKQLFCQYAVLGQFTLSAGGVAATHVSNLIYTALLLMLHLLPD
jgi:hypothetical protein